MFSRLEELEDEQAAGAVRGVDGELKNIIFASTGPKPRIVLRDALNNVIEVVENEEYCLLYDRALTVSGLTWAELADWWGATQGLDATSRTLRSAALCTAAWPHRSVVRQRVRCFVPTASGATARPRTEASNQSPPPQVYLHDDPRTRRERGGQPSVLMRERMDFLLLLPHGQRIVLEVDGKQHYADGDTASPRLYSEMVSEDRRLRLRGYEVYRSVGSS